MTNSKAPTSASSQGVAELRGGKVPAQPGVTPGRDGVPRCTDTYSTTLETQRCLPVIFKSNVV